MAVVIGLTGSIATGKSTISAMIAELGIPIVDADKIARDVVKPGERAYEKIVTTFGENMLNEDKTINRKKLGRIVFANEENRTKLNEIIHPEIRKEMLQQRDTLIAGGEPCIVMDIPLLFESKLMHFVDKIIVVYVDESTQLARLMKRDQSSAEEAQERIQAQIPVSKKANLADAIIDNSQTKKSSQDQLISLFNKWNIIKDEK
ncbi:dephospho-CoA kinase [Virgibacillus sp. W0181]|uniref:dephospho-CoA kinase n=1 Tax=Virgibacillus sp. W0181 TaxID=3391581 RepID=UPI003F486138